MENKATHRTTEENKRLILYTAAGLFLNKGYTATTLREIAKKSGVNIGSLMYSYESKENILNVLVAQLLEKQFEATERLLRGVTEDRLLFWAAETTLQLYITESGEQIRELYLAAYSGQKTAPMIYQAIAEKMRIDFQPIYPQYEAKDFYELGIATGGVIRGYISVPCDMYFTMKRKVRRCLEVSLLAYRVPEERIEEAIRFVSEIEFSAVAQRVIEQLQPALFQQ